MNVVKCTVDGSVSVVSIEEPMVDNVKEHIGGWMELVYPTRVPIVPWLDDLHRLVLVVDDEGFLRDKDINRLGCFMYETYMHGTPVVGDIIVAIEDLTIPDMAGFDDEQLEFIVMWLKSRSREANRLWQKT